MIDEVILIAKSGFSMTLFAIWAIAGAALFAALYVIAQRIGVPQHFKMTTLVVPGALLCAVAAGVFGSPCGLIAPVLYAGMVCAMRVLAD